MAEPLPDGFPRFREPKERHERGCVCAPCRGRRNKRKGSTKQSAARKALEKLTGKQARWHGLKANEEAWAHLPLRVECKAGAQVGPVATRFLASENQADASKATGDPRPFVSICMPDGWGSDGIVQCRLSQLARVVEALVNQ
jgi:hypothetical protein